MLKFCYFLLVIVQFPKSSIHQGKGKGKFTKDGINGISINSPFYKVGSQIQICNLQICLIKNLLLKINYLKLILSVGPTFNQLEQVQYKSRQKGTVCQMNDLHLVK